MESKILKGHFPKIPTKADNVQTIIVMPVNSQGILDLSMIGRRFKFMFKKTFKSYLSDCYFGLLDPGDVTSYSENDCIVYLLCYKKNEVSDKVKVQESMQSINLSLGLDKILKEVEEKYSSKEIYFYSPPIPFAPAQQKILNSKLNATWYCMPEEP